MGLWKLASAVTMLIVSASVNAAIITHGNLTTDDTTNFIIDTVTGRQYMRFDAFDLSVTDTVTATRLGGLYEDWSIATSQVADEFYSAALGVSTTTCTGATTSGISCGIISNWADGDFGATTSFRTDHFWYLSPNSPDLTYIKPLGYGLLFSDGIIKDYYASADSYLVDFIAPSMNALLYRDVAVVPVPAAVWLFGSGLIGLVGFARSKKA